MEYILTLKGNYIETEIKPIDSYQYNLYQIIDKFKDSLEIKDYRISSLENLPAMCKHMIRRNFNACEK